MISQERSQIIRMKKNGSSCSEIRLLMKKNIKAVQSIRQIEKKSKYAYLKKAQIDFGFKKIMELQCYDETSSKSIGKIAIKLIKEQLELKSSNFWNLIPEQKKVPQQVWLLILQNQIILIISKIFNCDFVLVVNKIKQILIKIQDFINRGQIF